MFTNYFKTAFRNLMRSRIYSFINIAGLSMGLSCAMLIVLYVQDEVSYDRFHKNVNQIYRIDKQQTREMEVFTRAAIQAIFLARAFLQEYPRYKALFAFSRHRWMLKQART